MVSTAPPAPSSATTPAPAGPIGPPVQLTPFIGRNREVQEALQLLETARLLTLTGAGGSGKTRLAAELAARASPAFPHGVAWLELAPLSDAALVPQHIAAAAGIRELPERSATDALVEALRDRAQLIVLDNCEHLVDACAVLAETLLRNCPALRILATSREALGVTGETAWLVPPLSLPERTRPLTAMYVGRSEAVQLFVDRARASLPSFALTDANAAAVARICQRLDGIPLALELAAARVRVLAPEQIAQRLEDGFRLLASSSRTVLPRHRTLRETIDWSYALLSDREQAMLQRLAVFVNGFSLDAAEAVCPGEPVVAGDVLDLIAALVDKSLVVMETDAGEARYRLLETVRQYAVEKLADGGSAERYRARHARFFLERAEQAEPSIFGGAGDPAWMDWLDRETDNLRAAAEWAEADPSRAAIALRLATAIHWYWFARGRFREGLNRIDTALAIGASADPLVRARALTAGANMAFWRGESQRIEAAAREAVSMLRELDDARWLAYALVMLGVSLTVGGNAGAARDVLDEAVRIARSLGTSVLLSLALYWQGLAARARSEPDLARACFEEAHAVGRVLKSRPAIAHPLTMLGRLLLDHGDHDAAVDYLREALAIHAEAGDLWGTALVLEDLARGAVGRGRPERAARLLGAAAALRSRISSVPQAGERAVIELATANARAALDDAEFDAAWDEATSWPFDDVVAFALESAAAAAPIEQPASDVAPALRPPDPVRTASAEAAGPHAPAPEPGPAAAAADLRVLALGALQIYRGDQLLDADVWGSAKPRELLVFLLCHPDGCTKDQVGLAFWPDASPAQVRNNFHVTLHRLRKALGHPEWIILDGDRYRVQPDLRLEFDAASFERDVPAALRLVATDPAAAADRLRTALALHRGEFLENEVVGDWHLEHRDRLRRIFIDGARTLGEVLFDAGRFAEAADAFRAVVARDDLHEAAYRRLMACHARLGERAQALRLYQRLADLLRHELGTEPDEETVALHDRLVRGDAV